MSKIFEALSRGQGELANLPLAELLEIPPAAPSGPVTSVASPAPEPVPPAPDVSPAPPVDITATPATANPGPVRDARSDIRVQTLKISSMAPLLPFDHTDERSAEQYRIIRTRLLHHPKKPRMIIISSAGPGDGKSVTAVNLAGALSLKTDANILLADLDLRRSTLHDQLGLSPSPGVSHLLAQTASLEEALVRAEQFPNLYILPAGMPTDNPSELLDSERWKWLCGRFRSMFQYIIIDTPPVASVADYELLQASCDGVVLVVRPDHTNRAACRKALDLIPKEKLLGAIMNCVPDWFLTGNYRYSFYYYDRQRK